MSRDWEVPPGYRDLEDLVREHGPDHAQANLASGQWSAFRFDLETGERKPIQETIWCVSRGRKLLGKSTHIGFRSRGGRLIGRAIIVRVPEQPQPRRKRERAQTKRVRDVIGKRFPNGTDGIATKVVHKAVAEELKPDSKKLGFAIPDETTVRRVLGRRKDAEKN